MDTPERNTQRLFFALWPSAEARTQMAVLQERLIPGQAKKVIPDNLHATLVFLGNQDMAQQQCIVSVASEVRVSPFRLSLDRMLYRKRQQMFWLSASDIPDELRTLYDDLSSRLLKCGYVAEEREFFPHVTLARNLKKKTAGVAIDPISWEVDCFVLVSSVTHASGARYRVLREWK